MSSDWTVGQLSDIATIVMGQSPSSDLANTDEIGLPLLNGPTEFGAYHPTPTQYTPDAKRLAKAGDILFCVRGSTTGRMNWADRDYAIGRGIASISHKHNYQSFLRALIEYRLPELLVSATGSTFPNVSKSQLHELQIPIPPLSEQREIANILGALDDKIEANRRENETLEAIARAIFKSWFVDFDPVHAKAKGEQPVGMDAQTAALFPDSFEDSELGMIPRGWRAGVLDDAIEILSGGTPKTSIDEYWDGHIPWFSVKDLPSPSDVFVIDTERTITQKGVDNSATKILPLFTTIISARGTVGKLALTGVGMVMNQSCYGIRGANDYPNYFTYFHLKALSEDLQRRTHGTVFDTITRKTFEAVQTVLPSLESTLDFERNVEPIMQKILNNLKENQTLAETRDALLPRLISGELRVGEV